MRRALLVLGLLLAAPPLALAQGCTPEQCMPAPMPPFRSVWTVFTTVEAQVHEDYAVVRIIEDIGNRGPDPEFPFSVRVPSDAFVSGLTILRDGQEFVAKVAPRAEARQQYDATKQAQQTGGLVEQQRGTSVVSYLINVAEFTSVRAVLTYEQLITQDQGVLRLPLEAPVSGFGQDRGARFDVSVGPRADVPSAWSEPSQAWEHNASAWRTSYSVGPRAGTEAPPTQFNVSWALDPTGDAGDLRAAVQDGTGWFVHRFRAPADMAHMPLDLILVLDTSGSMQGQKMQQLQDAATQVIGLLKPEDKLHLVFFSSDAQSSWPGLKNATADLKRDAATRVHDAFATGATNIEGGLRDGFHGLDGVSASAEESRLPVLVLLTDGKPTVGIQERPALRQLARDANAHGVHVFGLAFGSDADWSLIAGFAQDGNGTAIRVPEGAGAEVDIRRFVAALTTPALRNVQVRYDGPVTAFQRDAPVLFTGSELLVLGKFDPAMRQLTGNVTAQAPDGPRRYAFTAPVLGDGDAGVLPRLVANEEIHHAQDAIAADGRSASLVKRITDLALQFGFVTEYTSLVVRLPENVRMVDDCSNCIAVAQDATGSSASSGTVAPTAASTGGAGGSGNQPAQGQLASRGATSSGGSGGSGGLPSAVPTALHQEAKSNGDPFAYDAGAQQEQLAQKGSAAQTPGFEVLALLGAVGLAVALRARRK
ncbi:MAG: VIT and VWA domain-containing protein [Halobacteriales archaeon]|nr:VIT and VWA domain-containing protein [Halobacteriales archaeon]